MQVSRLGDQRKDGGGAAGVDETLHVLHVTCLDRRQGLYFFFCFVKKVVFCEMVADTFKQGHKAAQVVNDPN